MTIRQTRSGGQIDQHPLTPEEANARVLAWDSAEDSWNAASRRRGLAPRKSASPFGDDYDALKDDRLTYG
jgi:hypothetical protein